MRPPERGRKQHKKTWRCQGVASAGPSSAAPKTMPFTSTEPRRVAIMKPPWAGPGWPIYRRPGAHHAPKKPLLFASTEPKKRIVIMKTYTPPFAGSRPRPPTGGGGVVVIGSPPKKCISTEGARWPVRRPAEAGDEAPTKVSTREPTVRAATTATAQATSRDAERAIVLCLAWRRRPDAWVCKASASNKPGRNSCLEPVRLE